MIYSIQLLLFLHIIKFINPFGIPECKVLANVCVHDDSCLDAEVFYVKCLQKYVIPQEKSPQLQDYTSPILYRQTVKNHIYVQQDYPSPYNIPNNQRAHYQDFPRQSLIVPTEERFVQNREYVYPQELQKTNKFTPGVQQQEYIAPGIKTRRFFSPEKEKREDFIDTQTYPVGSKKEQIKDLYAAYKRESLRESLRLLRDQIQNKRASQEQVPSLSTEEREYNPVPLFSGSSSRDSGSSSTYEVKKNEVLKNTFDFIKDLITKEKDNLNNKIISDSSDTLRQFNKKTTRTSNSGEESDQTEESELKASNSETQKHSTTLKDVASSTTDYKTPDKEPDTLKRNLIDSQRLFETEDREEIAEPVFAPDFEDQGKVQDSVEDKGQFTVNTLNRITEDKAEEFGDNLQYYLWKIKPSDHKIFHLQNVKNSAATYRMIAQPSWFPSKDNAVKVSNILETDGNLKDKLQNSTGVSVLSVKAETQKLAVAEANKDWDKLTVFTAVVGGCSLALIVAALFICFYRRRNRDSTPVGFKKQEAVQDYQELCRTQMSVANSKPEEENDEETEENMRSSWSDDPYPYNMDITTGHVILSYMEDHLKNENRLNKEWEALCSYKAEETSTSIGADPKNSSKNRFRDVLPYDSTRVTLRETSNVFHSDYINANFITDVDPRNPAYIATQGPLDNTVADFWQMVWENGVVVIVNLTKLSDMGLPQCHRYWPEDGSQIYHIYEVHLISEHIWCDDYLVRSLYLKNLQTGETRTITQFHYLTWPDLSIPDSPKPLLEFRRKVNKCYRGHQCPVIVHCNNGVGRSGTYILLDMVLNKMIKGTKEIDIAATLEHLRDQRPDMVKTKGQFEFALTAVAEEVTAILSSAPR